MSSIKLLKETESERKKREIGQEEKRHRIRETREKLVKERYLYREMNREEKERERHRGLEKDENNKQENKTKKMRDLHICIGE